MISRMLIISFDLYICLDFVVHKTCQGANFSVHRASQEADLAVHKTRQGADLAVRKTRQGADFAVRKKCHPDAVITIKTARWLPSRS